MNRANSKIFKAIIVGGGASGLALAVKLSEKFSGTDIALIEKLDRVGKKLLSTGNGQCNLTNKNCSISRFHGENSEFCAEILSKYGYRAVCDFFENLGVLLTEDGDKIYPLSKQASSIVDALRYKISSQNTGVILGSEVVGAYKEDGLFYVKLNSGEILISQNLIISVGGKAQKHLGTDGSSYILLENFGHKTTQLFPSIVQLKCEPSKIKGLKGLKQKVILKTGSVGKEISCHGDLLFTDYGISGNTAFYLSSYLKSGDLVWVDFCPELTVNELKNSIIKKQLNCSYLNGENLTLGVINVKIANSILRNSGINLSKPVNFYNAEEIAKIIKNYPIKITGSLGFDYAQVTKGGIKTCDFSNVTLESNFVNGLYATGEVLDIDGDCGGYNLTWAFSSAFAVAEAIK